MKVPTNTTLPFFAYGLFKPGQLGFHRIKECVEQQTENSVNGRLCQRDGLPLLVLEGNSPVPGWLLTFSEARQEEAYRKIVAIEPDKQYRWQELTVRCGNSKHIANALIGKQPERGSMPMEAPEWDGQKDALFTSALEVVEETLEKHAGFEWDLKPLFHLQMAYLLLWSSIERYLSLKYHLGKDVTKKVDNLAQEPAFAAALKDVVRDLEGEPREIVRADQPGTKVRLNPTDPVKSVKYYYQVRSNITHRGKAVVRDHEIVEASLRELLAIFRQVLASAFAESSAV
jgi:hypothetical protein